MSDPLSLAVDLGAEVDRLVAALVVLPPRAWAAAAGPLGSRAAVARHLAGVLASASVESEGAARVLPVLPEWALPDQLAVVGHDLVLSPVPPERLTGGLAEVLLHRLDLTGARPGRGMSQRLLGVWGVAAGDDPVAAVLELARSRCPAVG